LPRDAVQLGPSVAHRRNSRQRVQREAELSRRAGRVQRVRGRTLKRRSRGTQRHRWRRRSAAGQRQRHCHTDAEPESHHDDQTAAPAPRFRLRRVTCPARPVCASPRRPSAPPSRPR
jgi:hypothetical protein